MHTLFHAEMLPELAGLIADSPFLFVCPSMRAPLCSGTPPSEAATSEVAVWQQNAAAWAERLGMQYPLYRDVVQVRCTALVGPCTALVARP